jgi:hypothetical protein
LLKDTLLDSPMRSARLLIALSSLSWAVSLLLPGDAFEYGKKIYIIMAMIAPDYVWGILFLTHCVASLITLNLNIRNNYTLILDAALGCILWTTASASFYVGHWPTGMLWSEACVHYRPPGVIGSSMWMALFSWWYLIRHWAGEGQDDECSC